MTVVILVLVVALLLVAEIKRRDVRKRGPRASRRGGLDKSVRTFRTACQQADQLIGEGRIGRAGSTRAQALRALVNSAGPDVLVNLAPEVNRCLLQVVRGVPSEGLDLASALQRRCPACVSDNLVAEMMREWVQSTQIASVRADWNKFSQIARERDRLTMLLHALLWVPRDKLSSAFARSAVRELLLDDLDRRLRLAGTNGMRAEKPPSLKIAEILSDGSDGISLGDLYCRLGDSAAHRGETEESIARYQTAIGWSSAPAAERLAHQFALKGHDRMNVRDMGAAKAFFLQANRVCPSPEYHLLSVLTEIVGLDGKGIAPAELLRQLDAVDARQARGSIAFWKGILNIEAGRVDEALEQFKDAVRRESPGSPIAEEAGFLIATLEKDDSALVRAAQRLVRAKGDRWLEEGPLDPWPMVVAVARRDEALLTQLFALLPASARIPKWVRVTVGDTLVRGSLKKVADGSLADAAEELDLALHLLKQG